MLLGQEDFIPAVRGLRESGARFLTLEARNLPGGEVELLYSFAREGEVRTLRTWTVERAAPSLFSFYGSADFPEREAARTFGVKFLGHPNLPRPGGGE